MDVERADVASLLRAVKPLLPDFTGLAEEFYYSALPFCAIDAVFSIGVRYGGVRNTVERVATALQIAPFRPMGSNPPTKGRLTISEFLGAVDGRSPEVLADTFFGNRQRTSARNGILKAEAVLRFHEALSRARIEDFADMSNKTQLEEAEQAVKSIPGQGSGTSFAYFQMLAGSDQHVKADRMIQRFVSKALGWTVTPAVAATFVHAAATELAGAGQPITPRDLDYLIWDYQRQVTRPRPRR